MLIAEHIPEAQLVQLARSGEAHAHLTECVFCREQLEQLRELFGDEQRSIDAQPGSPERKFRLAAQSAPDIADDIVWRQTWYLDDGQIVVRVVEDSREGVLIGYLLADPLPEEGLRVRFSDIDAAFVPDADGRFVIGPASIEIEPMLVLIE